LTPTGTCQVCTVPSAPVVPSYEHVTIAVLPVMAGAEHDVLAAAGIVPKTMGLANPRIRPHTASCLANRIVAPRINSPPVSD
jgi:hypothetical protein